MERIVTSLLSLLGIGIGLVICYVVVIIVEQFKKK